LGALDVTQYDGSTVGVQQIDRELHVGVVVSGEVDVD
jgi:hypothetical protein